MSSAQVQRPVKVENPEDRNASKNRARLNENVRANRKSASNVTGHFPKKHKYENEGRNKFGRKRAQSFTVGGGKFFPPYKRRKKEGTIIPPTKFLLGGNIYDPLNLNSLQDEEINRAMNAVTPKSSPLPTPRHRKGEIEVIIPPNLHDPLNLISCEDDAEYEQQLVSPTKRGRKSRKKKKRNSSSGGSSKEDGIEGILPAMTIEGGKTGDEEKDVSLSETVADTAPELLQDHPVKRELNLDLPLKEKDKKGRKSTEDAGGGGKDCKSEKKRKVDLKDKIVSPVIPQPGAWKRPPQYSHRGGGNMTRGDGPAAQGRFNRQRPMPKFSKKQEYFQYGNYLRYYGYRNPQHEQDVRVKFIEKRKELFQDKDVLDIGCNIGHVTMLVARDFGARSVVGLDIDRKLINIARKNVRHYVNFAASPPNDGTRGVHEGASDSKFFPISMPILYGPVDIPGISHGQSPSASKKFPHNVTFVQGNYVLDSDALLATEQPQFDVILCLSITKWLHLNWGDSGLKQAFRRMYLQLRPGGHLILEPQAWESYKRKKNLTETIFKNYNSIEFYPQKFTEYLLSTEVGFTQCEVIGTPFHHSKGFQRPIQMFTKGEISPARSAASNTNTPSHTIVSGASRPRVYAAVSISSREVDDDETSVQDCAIETANDVPMEVEESKKVELNFVSSRSCDDDYQGSNIKPDIESKAPLNVESVPNVRLSVIRKVEKGIEHEGASSVKLEVDVLVPEKMEENEGVIVKVERERVEDKAIGSTDMEMNENKKLDIDDTVSESTNEQDNERIIKVESDKVQSEEHCITESVKMETNET